MNSSCTEPRSARPPSILVVDDEIRIAETLMLILQASGYEARAAFDAVIALDLCREAVPDLIISDVVMPGMNGIELGNAIRRQYPACRVLLFSGNAATAGMMDDARARGEKFELLAKPVHPQQLLAKIGQMLQDRSSALA